MRTKHSNTTNVKVKLDIRGNIFAGFGDSNTTNVKVKPDVFVSIHCNSADSNTTNVKVKHRSVVEKPPEQTIQIQPMLRLNRLTGSHLCKAKTIQIQPMLRLNYRHGKEY